MKNQFLLILVLCFLSTFSGCKKIQERRNPKISGRVLDYYTRQPLANAKVIIGKIQEADFYAALDSVTTDENGYYEITSEPKFGKDYDYENDHFIVSAKKEGYEITYANKSFDGFDEFYINVRGSVNTEFKNLYLRKEIKVEVTFNDQFPSIDFSNNNYYYCYLTRSENSHYFIQYPGWHKTLNSDYNSGLQVKFLTNLDKISFTIPVSDAFLVVDLITGGNPPIFLFSQKIDASSLVNHFEIVL